MSGSHRVRNITPYVLAVGRFNLPPSETLPEHGLGSEVESIIARLLTLGKLERVGQKEPAAKPAEPVVAEVVTEPTAPVVAEVPVEPAEPEVPSDPTESEAQDEQAEVVESEQPAAQGKRGRRK